MERIYLAHTNLTVLNGKTVKGVSYLPTDYYKPHLIITFTDDTYIMITAKQNDEDNNINSSDIILANAIPVPVEVYSTPPGYVGSDGKFHYRQNVQEQIDLGLIEGDTERELNAIMEKREADEQREYAEYLRLKNKYETCGC